jgi:hypothetical protein
MAHMLLSADTIHELNEGKVGALINALMKKATHDIIDRPGEGKARKVALTFFLSPKTLSDGTVDKIDVQVKGKVVIPDYATQTIDAALRATGGVIFSSDSPNNVDQNTFDYPNES